jgi:hypothetical protein
LIQHAVETKRMRHYIMKSQHSSGLAGSIADRVFVLVMFSKLG